MHRTLAQIAGENARSIRINAGLTLDEVATVARVYGLPWTTGRVGDFESGRVSPSLPTLFAFALALAEATSQPLRLADLLAGDGEVALNNDLTVPTADLRAALSGTRFGGDSKPMAVEVVTVSASALRDMAGNYFTQPHWRMREADHRLAKSFGDDVAPEKVLAAMLTLWGQPFTAERDQRAGVDANAQRKGQISRQLKTEIQQYLKPGRKRRGNSK